jgi:nucleoside 2-deoxyribosyltransferase
MADRPRCYVASPLGFSEPGRHYYYEVLLPALAELVEPLDPWSLVPEEEIAAAIAAGEQERIRLEIGGRNRDELERCELLVAVIDGAEVDSGTAAEIGYVAARGRPCYGLRSDFRAGELGGVVNLQIESFIVFSGGRIVDSLSELLAVLRIDLR